MPHIHHMPKLLDVHLWGKYSNIYATKEVTVIKTGLYEGPHTDRPIDSL